MISNDPKTPQLELKVSADIQVVLSLEPDRVFMKQIPKGSKQTQTVTLVGSLADKATILSVESNRPELKAVLGKNKQEIQLTLQAPDKPELFNARVKVTTDQEVVREITLPVSAEVTSDLVLSTTTVMFSPFDPASPSSAAVVMRSLAGKPFKITKVVDVSGAVSASFIPKGNPLGSEFEVSLKLTKEPAAPIGSLTIQTDRLDQPTLSLQYNVRPKVPPRGSPALPR